MLYGQAIAERFHRHQTCPTRAPEGSTKHRKKSGTSHCKNEPNGKDQQCNEETVLTNRQNNQYQNGRIKFTHNNINVKCKWPKCPNQKTQTSKPGKKSKPISVLYSGDPSHTQRHT